MRIFTCVLFLCCIMSVRAGATHIVGGEIELQHDRGYYYYLRLIQYFDRENGNPGAEDQQAQVFIFNKSRNRVVSTHFLPKVDVSAVEYTQPECAIAELQTNKLIYETRIYMGPSTYNDPQGYYAVYERCCRNNIIDNIVAPEATGQTFILEFPPVVRDGEQFVNSTPQLFPPLSDYGCVFKPYYADFAGFDPDGDSLVYSLANPINSSTGEPLPIPSAAPHPRVSWKPGYSKELQVSGKPPLAISSEGLLTVTPDKPGLFVFSVKCEEFRDGEKIGEVRRDFQILVITDCDAGSPPKVTATIQGESRKLEDNELITIRETDAGCLEFKVSDIDTQFRTEYVQMRARAVNFDPEDYGWSWSTRGKFVTSPQDTLTTSVCLDKCPVPGVDPLIIDFIAGDNSCPKPLLDTLRVRIHIEREVGTPAYWATPSSEKIERNLLTGESFEMTLLARDDEMDSIRVGQEYEGLAPEGFGVEIQKINEERGIAEYKISFTAECEKFVDQPIAFAMLVEDIDTCSFLTPPDTVFFNLKHVAPEPSHPVLTTNAPDKVLEVKMRDRLDFNLYGTDANNDSLYLDISNRAELPSAFIYDFTPASGKGTLTGTFAYVPGCEAPALFGDTLSVDFVLRSVYDCGIEDPDTLTRQIVVLPPDNEPPVISIDGTTTVDYQLIPGESMTLDILGFDADNDYITMEMAAQDRAKYGDRFTFQDVYGNGRLQSKFIWAPGCEQLSELPEENLFEVRLLVYDQYCDASTADTLTLNLELRDRIFDYDFDIANAFTPNGDAFSEQFFIEDLPLDNCNEQFQSFRIVNRWGREVFYTRERAFRWDGDGSASGTYFYELKFTNKKYTGQIYIIF